MPGKERACGVSLAAPFSLLRTPSYTGKRAPSAARESARARSPPSPEPKTRPMQENPPRTNARATTPNARERAGLWGFPCRAVQLAPHPLVHREAGAQRGKGKRTGPLAAK